MKNYIFTIIFCIPLFLNAQPRTDIKADYDWILNLWNRIHHIPKPLNTWRFKPIAKDVNINLIHTDERVPISLLYDNYQISDTNGNLLLYSDGCSIADGQYQTINGGEEINKGLYRSCPGNVGLFTSLFLRNSVDTNSILLLHLNFGYDRNIGAHLNKLLCSKITKNKDSLKVVTIDSIVYSDIFSGRMTAVRHANGRDWWAVTPFRQKGGYFKILTQGDKMLVFKQNIGQNDIYDNSEEGGGQAVFSPDGTKHARYNYFSDLQIMDFDRCSGTFSNYIHIPIHDISDTTRSYVGCAISPNSRFLYVISYYYIYQFDLKASDVAASKIKVAIWDGTVNSLGYYLNFTLAQLAPDGRIYVTSGGTEAMHVIEYPDSIGVACKVIQRKHITSVFKGISPPNFPNYRLGALKGSPCDTLTTPTHDINFKGNLKIYPNPATDIIKVDMTLDNYGELGKCTLRIVDIVGRVHQTHPLSNYASIKEISVANMANGLYFVQLIDNQGFVIANSKIVVSR